MNNDGILTMPSDFNDISKEDMECFEGGWAVESRWFGYSVYLTHEERKAITNGQAVGGFAAALVGFGVMGVALVAAMGAVGTILWNMDEGNGVKINFVPAGNAVIPTGIWSLTPAQEAVIAESNRIF